MTCFTSAVGMASLVFLELCVECNLLLQLHYLKYGRCAAGLKHLQGWRRILTDTAHVHQPQTVTTEIPFRDKQLFLSLDNVCQVFPLLRLSSVFSEFSQTFSFWAEIFPAKSLSKGELKTWVKRFIL